MGARTPLSKKLANKQTTKDAPVQQLAKPSLKRKAEPEVVDLTAADASSNKKKKVASPPKVKRVDELQEWRKKMKKAFTTYTFYFDVGVNVKLAQELGENAMLLGAGVESFFSRNVTHVVTMKSVPDKDASKKQAALKTLRALASPPRTTNLSKTLKMSPTERNPFMESNADIVSKAIEMGIRAWPVDKFDRIVTQLQDGDSPIKMQQATRNLSLPHLLRAEQLSGLTHERDPQVLRPDFSYFAPKNYYLLVEDSTGEHKTIISKEYDRPKRGTAADYPVLHGGVEGRGAFTTRDQQVPALPKGTQPLPIPQARLVPVDISPQQQSTTMPPPKPLPRQALSAQTAAPVHSLRKSLLNQVARKFSKDSLDVNPSTVKDEAHGFLAASGNSQTLTSNIASMTSGAVLPAHHRQDQRLAVLNRRQIISHQNVPAVSRLGLGTILPKVTAPPVVKKKRSSKKSRNKLGLRNMHPAPPYEVEKPGYCENCRLRYDSFKLHVMSRKHRRFALDNDNWNELDEHLRNVERLAAHTGIPHRIYAEPYPSPEPEEADEMDCPMDDDDDDALWAYKPVNGCNPIDGTEKQADRVLTSGDRCACGCDDGPMDCGEGCLSPSVSHSSDDS